MNTTSDWQGVRWLFSGFNFTVLAGKLLIGFRGTLALGQSLFVGSGSYAEAALFT